MPVNKTKRKLAKNPTFVIDRVIDLEPFRYKEIFKFFGEEDAIRNDLRKEMEEREIDKEIIDGFIAVSVLARQRVSKKLKYLVNPAFFNTSITRGCAEINLNYTALIVFWIVEIDEEEGKTYIEQRIADDVGPIDFHSLCNNDCGKHDDFCHMCIHFNNK